MSSFTSTMSHFEELPDEILLLICRYLSSVDVLFSFYGLNYRLSQTISDYCRHVVLAQVPFNRFSFICTSILPKIGANIHSLTVSNEWTGVLSKVFIDQFGERMSLAFPRLKHLTLTAFIKKSLTLFIDRLQNFTELFEMTINGLFAKFEDTNEAENLLNEILSANNNRLNSIIFNASTTAFPVYTKNNDLVFPNIEKVYIQLKSINDLHRLLTILPRLVCLHTTIHEQSSDFDEKHQCITVPSLKQFHLQSFCNRWILKELTSVLKRIPNVEELSIEIDSSADIGLIDGHQIFSLLSNFLLKQFNYFVRLEDSSSVDHTNILSTWKEFNQEFVCLKTDDENSLILYSLPFRFPNLILQCSLAKNKVFTDSYAHQVRLLYLFGASKHVSEIFSIIPKCHRLHRLSLQINENILSKSVQQNHLWKLPYLTAITIASKSSIDMEDFRKLLEGSPNLYNLNIDDALFHPLLNDGSICHILQDNITHLCITISSTTTFGSIVSSISQLASIFSSLKYLYFWIGSACRSSESLFVAVFNHLSTWNYLISFVTAGIIIKPEILTKGIRPWVIENSSLCDKDSFIADYFEQRFRLWL